MHELNRSGHPVGFSLEGWQPPESPGKAVISGRFCCLEHLDPDRHANALFEANSLDREGGMWTYMPYGPFASIEEYTGWMRRYCSGDDPQFYAIVENSRGKAAGVASYLNIKPMGGSIEVGHIAFSPPLQRTPAATESMYLMMKRAFELGYRRYEWKCDALNAASRAAAQRLGFSFEGVFRQATVYKGRNRDTAWYAAIDREWPPLDAAFLKWLHPENFDDRGRQRQRLSDLTGPILRQRG